MSRWVVLSWHLWSPRTSRTQPRRVGGAQIEHIEHLVVGDLTEAQQQAVKGWGQAYWSRIQAGTPAVQSPLAGVVDEALFNPRYATRLTLENLNVLSSSDCESTLTAPQQDDTLALRKQASLKDSMVRLKFATDVNTNFQGTLDHIDKILDASVTSSVVAYIDGDKLVSEELPLDVLVASGAEPKSVSSLMQDEVNAINAIVASAPGYAAQSGTVSESKKLVTGQPSQADTVAVRIKALMSNLAMGDLPVELRLVQTHHRRHQRPGPRPRPPPRHLQRPSPASQPRHHRQLRHTALQQQGMPGKRWANLGRD